jgi:hypothetical protein
MQFNRRAKVKEVNGGKGEALIFDIPLGIAKIVCIAHIPYDGEQESVVYVRIVRDDNARA